MKAEKDERSTSKIFKTEVKVSDSKELVKLDKFLQCLAKVSATLTPTNNNHKPLPKIISITLHHGPKQRTLVFVLVRKKLGNDLAGMGAVDHELLKEMVSSNEADIPGGVNIAQSFLDELE